MTNETTTHVTEKEIRIRAVRGSTRFDEGEGAVDVQLEYGGFTGEVTLAPRQGDGQLAAWGDPDHWLSRQVLAEVSKLDGAAFRAELARIEAACVAAAAEITS